MKNIKFNKKECHVTVNKMDDWMDIIVNKELQIHISTNGGECYNIDLYVYNNNVSNDKRDWNDEYITSNYVSYDSINNRIRTKK